MRKQIGLFGAAIILMSSPLFIGQNNLNTYTGIIEAYAAEELSSIQEEINGEIFPKDGSTITNTWTSGSTTCNLYSDGTFIISGDGTMADISGTPDKPGVQPWNSSMSSINQVIIKDGVTSIGNFAFYRANNLKYVYNSGDTLLTIGECAFYDCDTLYNLYNMDSVTLIKSFAFAHCGLIQELKFINADVENNILDYAVVKTNVDFGKPIYTKVIGYQFMSGGTVLGEFTFHNERDKTTSTAYPYFPGAFMNVVTFGDYSFLTDQAFGKANIETLNLGKGCGVAVSASTQLFYNSKITTIVSETKFTSKFNVSAISNLQDLYLLADCDSSFNVSNVPANTMIYCYKDSNVHKQCESNGHQYTLLDQSDVDDLINGKAPELSADDKTFDANAPKDINFTVSLGTKKLGAHGISKVSIGTTTLKAGDYEFNGSDTVTIKSDYLKTLKNEKYPVTIEFDNGVVGSGASVTVVNSTITDNEGGGGDLPPDALVTITYEFYKDYPDYVIIPIKMNGASAITQLKIGTEIVDEEHYELQDGAIILDKDYLLTLDVGKYRVIPTFNDKNNTIISNIKLIVYQEAADRAVPYLLYSRIIFDKNNPVKLKFDCGVGDLQATNVLALIIDNDIILPNGNTVPFSSSAVGDLKQAFALSLEMDEPYFTEKELEEKEEEKNKIEIATPSEATPSEADKDDKSDSQEGTKNDIEVATPSEADKDKDKIIEDDNDSNDNKEENIEENKSDKDEIVSDKDEIESDKDEIVSDKIEELETSLPEKNTFLDLITGNVTKASVLEDDTDAEEKKLTKKEQKLNELAKAIADIEYSDKSVFTVEGNEITVDSLYIDSLGLSEGDHLVGAIFDNTERTTDIKKVILTIQGSETPDVVVPDKGNHSSGGGGGHSKPINRGPNVNNGTINTDGSININYNQNVPETGGDFSGSGTNWTYTKPDGTLAKNEWVGSNGYWYFIDENGKLKFDWYNDNSNNWYMLNREHNGHFGAALIGWYYEKQDGKWYFLNPVDSKMLTGWQFINGKWYYLHINNEAPTYVGDNDEGWKFTGVNIRPHGSMYVNEITPDNYHVDGSGAWIK